MTLHDGLCRRLPELVEAVFCQTAEVETKGHSGLDFVTSIDLALQHQLEQALPQLLPGSRVVGEEGFAGLTTGDAPVWLVDPLDGTVNFVAGLPCYAVAVALIEAGRPTLAAVYDIPHATLYSARAGGGAFCNGSGLIRRHHAARLAVLSSGLLRDLAEQAPGVLAATLGQFKLRNFGSQALHLCYAAAGRVSLVASREAKGWDDIAGALIAEEAGLRYGHYGAAMPATGADQYSLCAPADLFDIYAAEFARSIAAATPTATSTATSTPAPTPTKDS